MFFSVIVPLYNKVNSIVITLESILEQQHNNFEIIIVNDGSTDDGLRRVMEIDDPRLRIINQKNQGVSIARNAGIATARSEYLVFFDADDIMGINYLSHIRQLIEKFPDAGAYGTSYQYARNGRMFPSKIHGLFRTPLRVIDYFYTASKGDLPIIASGVCIPREVLQKVGGFPAGQTQGEDQDLWSRIGLRYSMAVHPSCDITYVLDAENRVSVDTTPNTELKYSQTLQSKLDNKEIPSRLINSVKRYIAGHLIHIAKLNIEKGDIVIAQQLLSDHRTVFQPVRRIKWQSRLLLSQMAKSLRSLFVRKCSRTSDTSKPVIANLLNDQKMGGILSVVKSLSKSRMAETYVFNFQLVNPTSWNRRNLDSDIIMVHYASSWGTIIPNLLTRMANPFSKVILQEHHYTSSFEKSVPSKKRFRIMLKLNYLIFNKVVAVSHGQSNWIKNANLLSPRKAVAIPQCRELSDFLSIVQKKPSSKLVVGAYGRLAPEKGFDKLIKAFNRVQHANLQLTIAGNGPEEHKLKTLANGNKAVSFVGKVDNIPSFLEKCDVIIIPSITEAFGLVCLEAKAAARPVFASNIDGLREQVIVNSIDQKCGDLLYQNSVNEIHKLLESIPQMPIEKWGRNGRNQVRNAWNEYQTQWHRFFQSLCY